ncbi:bacterio-opsin activator domain-containing protein [Halogeometricum luteum]|uniref:PAS domain S-box protein n=1 Tax=Halogeometricum luteum TaxID=2950537 RepID=A0ABU2G2Y7_9EURY|nr:bacterio-opsin activator domain-containing protein [Halogeometricum sp. S3BR5-2]MDS0295150.1 PAS domain S-box protein [Halogeometricum sp. S3BR5-2]
MTAESTATQSAVRVRLLGDGDRTSDVRSLLRDDERISLLPVPEGDDARAGATADADCLVCTTVDAVPAELGAAPLVVVLSNPDDESVRTAYRAGATDVLAPSETLPAQVAWLSGADELDAEDETPAATLVDAAAAFGDAACVLDRRWRVGAATDAFAELVGERAADGSDADELSDGEAGSDRSPADADAHLWADYPAVRAVRASCWETVLSGEATPFEEALPDGRRLSGRVVPLRDGVVVRVRDITEETETRESLDRYERILETIDDGIYILDENFLITEVNDAVTQMTGYDREELVGSHSTMLADESVIVEASALIQEILMGERSDGRLDVELETADGSSLPVETRFSALSFADGSHGMVGVIRDITDRKRYEETLTSLNRSAHELFESQTKPDVGETVLDTATDILELESVVVYLYDEEAGALQPVAWEGEGTPARIGPGDGALWTCFAEHESITLGTVETTLEEWDELAPADAPEASSGESVVIPLGEHGVLATVSAAEDAPRGQSTLTHLLAANAEAALDRVARSVELERRRGELSRRNEELTSLNRFNELLREVNRVLVEADSREAIEKAVCEQLVDGPSIAFAWVGTYDRVSESVVPRAWAGAERGYLDCLTDDPEAFEVEPSVQAIRNSETTVVDNAGQRIQEYQWRRDALDRGFVSVASFPLTYGEFSYGALTVYATEPNAFDERTRLMFEELGVTTANAINGAEAKESLHTESLIELDIRITSPNAPLLRISQAFGGQIRLEGTVPQPSGSSLLYLTVQGSDTDIESLSSLTVVERVRKVVERDSETLVEVQLAAEALPSRLADLGAVVRTLTSTPDALDVVVELAPGSDVREFVELLQEQYPGTELSAKRTRERSIETQQSFRAGLREALTDRQFEALRTAYFSGYFAWPRERTASDLAESLGVAQPTFARHLRVAERKLLDNLLADERRTRR